MKHSGTWSLVIAGLGVVTLAAALVIGAGIASPPRETLPGPVAARVVRIVDGDTIVVKARIWLGQELETHVRLEGVDAPEIAGRCERERALARDALLFLESKVADGQVVLRRIEYGKFAGRVVARVETTAGEDLSAALMAAGLARAYAGGRRGGWCETAAAE